MSRDITVALLCRTGQQKILRTQTIYFMSRCFSEAGGEVIADARVRGRDVRSVTMRDSRTRQRIAAAIVTCVSSLLSCGQEVPARQWTVTDSAGIEIVTNASLSGWERARWQLSDQPVLVIEQGEDPSSQWTSLLRTFWFGDGRIGVATSDPPFVRIYSPSGDRMSAFGAEGEGPGELRGIRWAGPFGDSVAVRDFRYLHVFASAGTYGRTVAAALSEYTDVLFSNQQGWVIRTQDVIGDDHSGSPEPPEVLRDQTIISLNADGHVRDTLARFNQMPTWIVQDALWGKLRHAASDGEIVYEMDSHRYEIRVHRASRLVRVIRAPILPAISGFDEGLLEIVREMWGGVADRMIELDREAGRLVVPPALHMLLTDQAELWVMRTDRGGQASHHVWDVFDPDGVWEATLETPSELMIKEVWGRHVLGIWTDELGLTSVRVYRVER